MVSKEVVDIEHTEEDMDAKQIIAERGYSLQKVNFKDSEGKECYACLLMSKGNVEKFQKAVISGKINLDEFGEVLFSGYGNEVPEWQRLFLDEMIDKKSNW